MRISFLLLCMLCLRICLLAQAKQITGKVTDENGVPLNSISVGVKNTRTITTTKIDGSYSINAPENGTLVFTGVGYVTKEMSVAGQSSISVTLAIDAVALHEVVVTGTGVATEKKKLSIDVASVSSKDFSKSAILSVDQALVGKISGAQIQSPSGEPGQKANIILRGVNSLGSTTPIILVDGVQVTDINGLDIANVDRVEVAKGPAAGMLYGAQGANGVIQIFTKKGTRNKRPSVSLSSKVSFDQALIGNDLVAKKHHYQTDPQGNILDKNGNILQPDANGEWPDPAEEDFNTNYNLTNDKTYPASLPLYDHLDQAYEKAVSFSNSVNIAGGGEKSDYAFTFSRLDQQSVLNNKLTRMNLSANLGFELFKGFTFRNTTQTIFQNENLLSGAYNVTDRILFNPDALFLGTNNNRFELLNSFPWINFKSTYSGTDLIVVRPRDENQLNVLSEPDWHERNGKNTRIINNANLNYKFPKFVELDYKYGVEYWVSEFNDFYKNQEAAPQVDEGFWGPSKKGSMRRDYAKSLYQNSLATLYFRTDFQKDFNSSLPIKTTTQVSYDYRKLDYNSFYSQGLNLPQFPPYIISSAEQKVSGDGSFRYITFGWLVNQTVDFGNLFGVTGGFRSDYNSEFGDQQKPFNFGRGTAYFRLSELLKSDKLTEFKIRGAYGEAGIPPHEFNGLYYNRQSTLGTITLGNATALFLANTAGNPELGVQVVKELELGTDITYRPGLGDWLGRISFSGSVWRKKNNDIINLADLPPSSGVQNIPENLIDLEVKGIDLSLDADMYTSKSLAWQFGVRFGTFNTKVTRIANGQPVVSGVFAVTQGQSLGDFYTVTALTSVGQLRPDKTPYIDPADYGDYEVVNGMVVNKTTKRVVLTDPNDQKVVGNAYPDFNMSFFNTVTFKQNLSLSFQFDWIQGNSIYNITKQWMYRDRIQKDFDKAVTIDGQTGSYVNFWNSLYNSVQRTGFFVEDGSFLRLRDVTLSYSIANPFKQKWVKNVVLTASGRNLLTFTNYSGLDPEATTGQDSQGNATLGTGSNIGVDYFGVPNLKSYQLGINLQF
ncbi:MAG TPA: SusC/RagA family TonB-linked outer membrane protein [Chitinophagaceae bacterium]|nr:SusC/RagA family TonB-linked outer membrane protein [Chitinophagaceae bacterium]